MGRTEIWNQIKSGGKGGFWQLAPWLFFICGLVLLAIAYFVAHDQSWRSFLISVGSLMLSAGVFSIILKSLQYLKVFEQEILRVFDHEKFEALLTRIIYGDRADDSARLRQLENLMSGFLASKCPAYSSQLIMALIENLRSTETADGFFRVFNRTIRIREYKSNTREIFLDDEVYIELNAKSATIPIRYSASATGSFLEAKGTLTVNGKDVSDEIKNENGRVSYTIPLCGSESYRIERKYPKKFILPDDPYMHLRLTRHTLNFLLKIENNVADEIGVLVKSCGFDPYEPANKWSVREKPVGAGRANSEIRVEKQSLTFPQQGYIIMLYEK